MSIFSSLFSTLIFSKRIIIIILRVSSYNTFIYICVLLFWDQISISEQPWLFVLFGKNQKPGYLRRHFLSSSNTTSLFLNVRPPELCSQYNLVSTPSSGQTRVSVSLREIISIYINPPSLLYSVYSLGRNNALVASMNWWRELC